MKIDLLWDGKIIDSVSYRKKAYSKITSNVQVDFSKWPVVSNQVRCYLLYDGHEFVKTDLHYRSATQLEKIALIVESPHKDEFSVDFSPLQPLSGKSGEKFDLNIAKKMDGWFSSPPIANTLFEVKIFNPVTYQTSLYHFLSNLISYDRLEKQLPSSFDIPKYGCIQDVENSSLRNEVWKCLFTNSAFPCEIDFSNELKSYAPQYIVNSCTGSNNPKLKTWKNVNQIYTRTPKKQMRGYSANNLKTIVRRSMFTYFSVSNPLILYREDIHPCQWR